MNFNSSPFFTIKAFNLFLLLNFFLKIFHTFFYGDNSFEHEWKILIYNLLNHNTLSYLEINGLKVPSVYMPPLYSFFLLLFAWLPFSEFILVKIILVVQSFISIISVYFVFLILRKYFSERLSVISSVLYLLYPLNYYSSSQISSLTLQIFLFTNFIYSFLNFKTKKTFLVYGITGGLMFLIRGEFYLLFVICNLFIFEKKKN